MGHLDPILPMLCDHSPHQWGLGETPTEHKDIIAQHRASLAIKLLPNHLTFQLLTRCELCQPGAYRIGLPA